jgi:CRP-like cAMP-binding protein
LAGGQWTRAGALEGRIVCLSAAPLFKGLQPSALHEVAAAARESHGPAKQPIFREGEPARELALLTAGRVKITQLTASGDVVIQRLACPGELVNGPGLSTSSLHAATPVALERCELLSWELGAFEGLSYRYPALQRNALRILAARVKDAEQRYRELATERMASRLARALLRLLGQMGRARGDAVVIALSREELGQMIGATLFSVSRLLCEWETRGIVASGREAVIVKDPAGLAALAEDEGRDEATGLRAGGRALRG